MGEIMEKAILVGLETPESNNFKEAMEELKNLALACNIEVLETMTQKLNSPTSNFYVGSGKVEEIKQAVTTLEANVVVFDDELSPSHIRNLEKELDVKVIDRTILILDIFARRAKTKEAMLQVELAQCEYMLPRVVGLYSSLSRQKSGTGSKGPGETKLELDRRFLRERVHHLKEELKELVTIRRVQREKRKKDDLFTVALAGYTNAGKSTMLNKLLEYSIQNTEKYVFEKDMLFATLETSTRNIVLPNKHQFLITDTVGFISKLPHHLIEAFKSTLEEITEASLILHVVDSSNIECLQQMKVVEEVLSKLGASEIPTIYVFNKNDIAKEKYIFDKQPQVTVSAVTGEGMKELVKLIDETLYNQTHHVKMILPFEKGNIYGYLRENAHIKTTDYQNDGIHLDIELTDYQLKLYHEYVIENGKTE